MMSMVLPETASPKKNLTMKTRGLTVLCTSYVTVVPMAPVMECAKPGTHANGGGMLED